MSGHCESVMLGRVGRGVCYFLFWGYVAWVIWFGLFSFRLGTGLFVILALLAIPYVLLDGITKMAIQKGWIENPCCYGCDERCHYGQT